MFLQYSSTFFSILTDFSYVIAYIVSVLQISHFSDLLAKDFRTVPSTLLIIGTTDLQVVFVDKIWSVFCDPFKFQSPIGFYFHNVYNNYLNDSVHNGMVNPKYRQNVQWPRAPNTRQPLSFVCICRTFQIQRNWLHTIKSVKINFKMFFETVSKENCNPFYDMLNHWSYSVSSSSPLHGFCVAI